MNKNYFEKKNIWLIGASAGIGKSLALQLSGTSISSLLLSSRDANALEVLKGECMHNSKVHIYPLDVSKKDSITQITSEILETHTTVDTLIYNAGIYNPGSPFDFCAKDYIDQINVNYTGALLVTEPILKRMIEKKSGHICIVSSVAAYNALPNALGYGASKSALSYFYESLRYGLEDSGIKITVIHPGFVETRLTAKNNFSMPFIMKPEQAAEIIASGISHQKKEINFPVPFVLILKLISLLPSSLKRKILKNFK